ncbi:ShlB/FhaC/HecB family hemolysin secretion/activation protein [Leptothermofonsia sichuanensis E412]|uniref:ShlB/FhaC/HecB family hemolysin secretion/activation protein n=1 Tax=Leptothermofonsia sichuanensis TaxID=2917832 RepID=UPI001CA67530|nr:ShlB/FhaC/HecB family hemolysin secretion/activation protein [Leptothermofonsia sichuanensis]QZZ20233.1 ShlB/FhaC/HecB family hemolysin secretion/activation protein [Leptothermofonsia sichuanensis E412]
MDSAIAPKQHHHPVHDVSWSCLLRLSSILCIAGAISLPFHPAVSLAQVPSFPTIDTPLQREPQPPSVQPQPEPLPPAPLPPPEQLLPAPILPAPPTETPPGDIPQTITVEQFRVTGSTVFTQADFDQVTEPYTKRPISVTELFQARSAVTQLYIENGYISSGAYIPPQQLRDGTVEIRVVEGSLEAIQVSGTRRLKPSYIESRLKVATRPPLNQSKLLEALQLLQLNPLIESISAELSAGSRPGENLLEVRVTEARTFDAQILLNNGRVPSVGTFQRQLQLSEANLLGFGDRLTGSYSNTDGSNAFDFSYTVPVNPYNGTIRFSTGISYNRVIEAPFNILDIESRSRYLELSFRQPILQTPTREIALGITGTQQQSQASLLDGEIPFPARGADAEGRTRLTALRFFQEATWRSGIEVIALRSQFSVGLNALGSTINDAPPDSRFFTWRGQAQWVRLLAPDTLFLLRGDMQIANRALLPFEQFSLGGLESVRGYRQDALLTDSGLFASAEVRIPIWRLPQINGLLQIAPFFDIGSGWNRSGFADPDPRTLASLGVGLRLQISNHVIARFDWGAPLINFPGDKNTLQEKGIYFSIIVSPF